MYVYIYIYIYLYLYEYIYIYILYIYIKYNVLKINIYNQPFKGSKFQKAGSTAHSHPPSQLNPMKMRSYNESHH